MADGTTNIKKVSRSEQTHAKNKENLHIVNTIIGGLGALYNPTNNSISKNELIEFETEFARLIEEVRSALTREQNAVGAQQSVFKPVSKRVTLIMKAARAQNLEAEFMDHLRSSVNRLNAVRQGVKPTSPEPNAEATTANNASSVSKRSYNGILESLNLICEQLRSNPAYAPNEPEFQTENIARWIDDLQILHNTALDAKIATRTARNARNAYAYNQTDGLLKRMNAVKNYLATILARDDTRLKQIKSLRFVDSTRT